MKSPKSCIFFFLQFFFFLFLPNRKKMKFGPKKRNKPIREEMRLGRGREVIEGRGGIGVMKGGRRGGGRGVNGAGLN